MTRHPFLPHRVHVLIEGSEFRRQRFRQVLVQLELHAATAGTGATGKSSAAAAAAKAMAAANPWR